MDDVHPRHYTVRIEPDLARFTFSGTTEIVMEADAPVRDITLHLKDLAVRRCRVRQGGRMTPCPFRVEPDAAEIRIFLPRAREGQIVVDVSYEGSIGDGMAGFYRSHYTAGGTRHPIAVTQFQESDARRAFPCVDHPLHKATFDIEMIADETLSVISNCPVAEETPLGNGKKRVRFQRTPKMSTYLVFFGVGAFDFLKDDGPVPVRVITTPGMTPFGRFALGFGRKALAFCEDFYGIPFPFPKLDLIAVPDFAFGAMENWAAITFRENLLLQFPDSTSKAGEERICEVIAHEMAHQWFGNLVTPSDWKYLWLNESFATYFGFGVVDHYHPDWEVWHHFLHSQTAVAFDRDALHETVPIELPGDEAICINSGTAPIIYNKGGSVLRQIKAHIGDDHFKDGLREYLTAHSYGCASSSHLWEAFERVSSEPVTRIMKSWIEQPGFPVVDVVREGTTLHLSQKRFTYLPGDGAPSPTWLIPVFVRVFRTHGESEVRSMLLEEASGRMPLGDDAVAYKVNDGQTGFYRVNYLLPDDLGELAGRIEDKVLPPEDRWGLENDRYALCVRGDLRFHSYLDFLGRYSDELAFLPLMGIAAHLSHAYGIADVTLRAEIASAGAALFERVLEHIGYVPRQAEPHTRSILRDTVLWHAVRYGSATAHHRVLEMFSDLMRGRAVHPDIMKSVMQAGAFRGDRGVRDWFVERLEASASEHERMNILTALGCFQDGGLIEELRDYILDKVPSRNKFIPLVSMAANPVAADTMWDWFVSTIERLERFHHLHFERVLTALVPVCGPGRHAAVRDFLEDYMSRKPGAADAIKLSLERLTIHSAATARWASEG